MITLLLACHGNSTDGPPVPTILPSPTQPETGTGSDTGAETCAASPPPARSTGPERFPEVHLHGEWSLQVGWSVALGNVDADPCPELLIGETRNDFADITFEVEPTERVVVLDVPETSGAVVDRGWTFAESGYESPAEDDEVYPHSRFGSALAVDRRSGALLVGAKTHGDYFDVASFALHVPQTQHIVDALGTLRASRELGTPVMTMGLGTIDLPSGHFLWTATYETLGPYALGGTVYLFDVPLVGAHDERDARAVYRADGGDFVQLGILAGDDLDGDGVADLVMGGHARNAVGEIAVLSDPPDGEHRIWDIAVATFAGTVEGGRLGDQVTAGDLDGDGQAELLTGAAMVYGSSTFHAFRGPAAGAHLASDSEWTIHGEDGLERLGVSSAAADLDGDGFVDLVVGRPGNSALGTLDGSVALFAGPVAPGVYQGTDADVIVRNEQAPGTADGFGYFLRTGDLNDDGAHDLVIAAPTDVQRGRPVGAVHVLYGRSGLFEP